ncbi:hypothetical protein Q4Q35_03565 [Flavivirga aquimarina]|uniref:ATPase AAA-type core domain-containing protein n=1 Tax=Flavivirga aquimarina TaxID=2027862 RepID=A0ABT8W6Y1_9FLAO|nr:hypothetical protein [Flavivirga aquimarina]MDO5968875.1 hypothetical protein [Flavivirga aquimarina]
MEEEDDKNKKKGGKKDKKISQKVSNVNNEYLNESTIEVDENSGQIIGNQINKHFHGKTFIDPTIIWAPNEQKSTVSLHKKDIRAYAEKLKSHRGLILYGEDKTLLDDSIDKIIKKLSDIENFTQSNRRIFINVNKGNSGINTGLEFHNINLNTLIHPSFKRKLPTFIRIDISNLGFLNSLFEYEKSQYDSIIGEFERNNIFLICCLSSKVYEQAQASKEILQKLKNDYLLPFQTISFLETFFEYHFPKEVDILIGKLRGQHAKGLWGSKRTQKELYGQIMKGYNCNPEVVKALIIERGKASYEESKKSFIDSLPLAEEPQKSIIFTAAFFQNISVWEFQNILECLLGNRSIKREITKQIVDKKNRVKKIQNTETIKLFDIWQEHREDLLSNCKLEARQTANSRLSLDFTKIGIADEIRSHFQNALPLYFIEQFEILKKEGVFFDTKYSGQTLDNMHALIITMFDYNPATYTAELLINMYHEVIQENDHDIIAHAKFRRILSLILVLSSDDKYKDSITTFLNYLLEFKFSSTLLYTLEEFVISGEIDSIFWAKKILDTNPKREVYNRVLRILIYDVANTSSKNYQKLKEINSWIGSEVKGHEHNLTASHFAAFSFLYQISDLRLEIEQYGEWPSKHPLFKSLDEADDYNAYFIFLISWLFNEHSYNLLIGSFNSNQEAHQIDIKEAVTQYLTYILESWSLVIQGTEVNEKTSIATDINEAFIKALLEVLARTQLNEIRINLGVLAKNYTKEIGKALRSSEPEKEKVVRYFNAKKTIVLHLKLEIETSLKTKK